MMSWLPIWAQAAWSTTRRMAHTVNLRGVPIQASPQGQPAAAPATSPQGQPTSMQGQPAAAPVTSPQGQPTSPQGQPA